MGNAVNEQEVAAKWAAAREADARERTAVNEAVPPKGTAVNERLIVVVHDEAGAYRLFADADVEVLDGIVIVWQGDEHIAYFRKWISVLRVKDYAEMEAFIAATKYSGAFTEEPPPRPRMRANMAPREEGRP